MPEMSRLGGAAGDKMRFHEPRTLKEVVSILSADPDARCVAGGQTLVALMNLRLVEPSALVSLRRIGGLDSIDRERDGAVRIGAMTTHRAVAASKSFSGGQRIVPMAAAVIGHPAIRNAGTIGGSIAHGDPAADYPTALVAADALIDIAGPSGTRLVPAREFFVSYLETALRPGEIVTAVCIPPSAEYSVGVFDKVTKVRGDFATVSAALVLAIGGGKCRYLRIALGACGPTPIRVVAAEERLLGSALSERDIDEAAEILVAACDPPDDAAGSRAYRLKLVPRLLRRAIESGMRDLSGS